MGKIVITGTGRCGTSFLMHFCTYLGLNTGYSIEECKQHLAQSGCDGGIEHNIGSELFNRSDIVKNPEWMVTPQLLNFDIDFIIVPIRELEKVAQSRAMNSNYGGFWNGASSKDEQMIIDAKAFYHFIQYTVKHELKVIYLDFPRIVHDSEYLYKKLGDKIGVYLKPWNEAFNEIANPGKVHI